MQKFDNFFFSLSKYALKGHEKKKRFEGVPSSLVLCAAHQCSFKKKLREKTKNVCFYRALSTSLIAVVNLQHERAKLG